MWNWTRSSFPYLPLPRGAPWVLEAITVIITTTTTVNTIPTHTHTHTQWVLGNFCHKWKMKNINNKKKKERMLDARGNCKKCARKMIFARLVDVDRPMMEGCTGKRQQGVTTEQRATVWRLQLAVSLTRQTAWRRRNASYAYKWSGSARQGGQREREKEKARGGERDRERERKQRRAGNRSNNSK